MSCNSFVNKKTSTSEDVRKQYPDYITYLKNREADKFFNKAIEKKKENGDSESIQKYLKNSIMLNPNDIGAKMLYTTACPKPVRDTAAVMGADECSIKGIIIKR